jgi:hypothetical protein
MAAMPSIEALIQSVDGRIREVNGEIASLQDARAALISNGSAPTPTSRRRAKRSGRRKPRRATNVLSAETAERMLVKADGLTTAALAEQAGADRDQVLNLLRDLETARRVRRTGQRRGTRWHAITDEERVQQRAAELESRTRRRGK